MSLFSEQNAILLAGLNDAKLAIEGKGGSVTVAKSIPRITEVLAGINSIPTGGAPAEPTNDLINLASNSGLLMHRNNSIKVMSLTMNDVIATTLT